jgi:hypothetical protein
MKKLVARRVFRNCSRHHRCSSSGLGAAIFVAIAAGCSAQAQEAVRASLAGAEAAEARRRAAAELGYYNLRLGPTSWRFAAALDIEANDNIELTSAHSQSDCIVRPGLSTSMTCPVTELNTLNFSLNAGYSAYAHHSELDRFYINPGSELALDLYVGDLWLNFHDRLTITENAYQDPTAVDVGSYSQLQNDAGLTTTWDLNRAVLKLGYDHVNYDFISGASGQPDASSEVFFSSAGYTFATAFTAGLELGGSLLDYSGSGAPFENATDFNGGAFVSAQITDYLHVRANGGYTVYSPSPAAGSPDPGDFTGVYGLFSLLHRVNRFLEYSLNGGRTVNFAYYGGTIDLYSAGVQATWRIFEQFRIATGFQYDHGSQMFSGQETFNRYGPSLSVEHAFTDRLSGSLRYQYFWRESDKPGAEYSVNVLTLGLRYQL